MLRMAKAAEVSLHVDPKPMERVTWQRLKVVVEHEACHRDWGCALYTLHRTGRIGNDEREAGDKYASLIRDHRKLWCDRMGSIVVYRAPGFEHLEKSSALTADVERLMGSVIADARQEESEFETKRAYRICQRYKEARAVAGAANSILEDMLIDEIWPVGERGHTQIKFALERLSVFFNTGTKRKPKK
jgi:hypothetical protein